MMTSLADHAASVANALGSGLAGSASHRASQHHLDWQGRCYVKIQGMGWKVGVKQS